MSLTPQHPRSGIQPIALVSQLRQQVPKMQHIDEMFLWMSHAMVHQWQIPLVQFWTTQAYKTGQLRLELRTVACQDSSLPTPVHANQQIANVVKRLLREKQGTTPLQTASVFSPSQAEILARYGLHYWAGYFIANTGLLPPQKEASVEQVATPLSMVISLFLQHPPSERLSRAIDFTLQHGLLVAASRGFLTTSPGTIQADIFSAGSRQPILSTLVPRRSEKIEEITTVNPFANATILPNKQTRQLYSLVNGQRNVATLAQLANLDQEVVKEVLRFLLQQEKIQLYDEKGNSIDAAFILKRP